MAYIGNSPGVSSQRIVNTFTATAGQTTFTPSSGYTIGYVDVYLNGIKLVNGTDYTASNGSTVVLTETAAADDVVEVMAYIPRGMSDGYTKSEADTRYVNSTGDSITGNLSFGDNDKAIFGAGSDLQIYHDGSNSRIVDNGTGNLNIQAESIIRLQDATGTDNYIKCVKDGSVDIYYDGSSKLNTTSTGIDVTGEITADGIALGDSQKATFGASDDLQIYHDGSGSHSYIKESGSGSLYIQGDDILIQNSAGTQSFLNFANDAAYIRYAGATKLATTSTGIDVTGTVAATAFTGDGSALTGIDSLPSQSGNSGKYLTTNGTSASWATLTVPDEVVISSTAPSSPTNGILWFDSSINCLKLYSGGWLALQTIPTLNSISGGINSGSSTDLTLSVTDATSTVSIEFYDGSTLVSTVTGVSVSGGSATVTVPSAVYSLSIGTTVSINIVNSDNVKSNSVDEDVFDPPIVGGTESISGGYKYHAFTSSGTLTVPSSQSNVEVLIVGGGGSGGTGSYGVGANSNGAGGGAGGVQNLTSQTLSTGSYSITVGAGASGVAPQNNAGNNGSSSSALGTTAGGGNKNSGLTGGSSGTPQSNSGGGGGSYSGGGGGGAGGTGVGGGGNTSKLGGAGSYYGSFTSWGAAAQSTATTTPSPNGYFAGGGAGAGASAVGRASGGGGSSSTNSASSGSGIHAGFANTGGGGGGGYAQSSYSGNGGSGIVIFRYPV